MALAALGNGGHDAQNVRMPLPLKSMTTQPKFRDRKRWSWLLSVVGPGVAATGTLAHTLGATSLWWFALPLLLFYGVIPLTDW